MTVTEAGITHRDAAVCKQSRHGLAEALCAALREERRAADVAHYYIGEAEPAERYLAACAATDALILEVERA